MNDNDTREQRRMVTWVALLVCSLVAFGVMHSINQRAEAYAEYKRRQIVSVTGHILSADCSIDPVGGMIECDSIVVIYPSSAIKDDSTYDITRTFAYSGRRLSIVPQIGNAVTVTWTRGDEESAYLMLNE
jgi:hypothetical protein